MDTQEYQVQHWPEDFSHRRRKSQLQEASSLRIVPEGLRGGVSIAELRRKEGIHQNVYYKWSKDFLEAGKNRLQGDTDWEAVSKTKHKRNAQIYPQMSQNLSGTN